MKTARKPLAGALLALAVLALPGRSLATTLVLDSSRSPQPPPLETVQVVVEAGSEKLWEGMLRVSASGPGNTGYEETTSQPYEPCDGQEIRTSTVRQSERRFSIRISRREWRENPDRFSVSVRWQRPYSLCQGGGSATVEFDRVAIIGPKESKTLTGDGGLTVTLRRLR